MACALVAMGFIDTALRDLIEREFTNTAKKLLEDVFETAGSALSSLSSKINLSYALGLISTETWSEVHRLRRIRNEFAHSHLPLTFANSVVAQLCLALQQHGLGPDATNRDKFVGSALIAFGDIAESRNAKLRAELKAAKQSLKLKKSQAQKLQRIHAKVTAGLPLTAAENRFADFIASTIDESD